jgi:hypothetical protein
MTRKRFVIEMGTGVEQHGQSANAAVTVSVDTDGASLKN